MITKLSSKNIPQITQYLKHDAEQNLFFLADIENYCIDEDDVEVFANSIDGDNDWDFIILHYFTTAIIYSKNESYDIDSAVKLLKTFSPLDHIGGKNELLLPLKEKFPLYTYKPSTLLACRPETLVEYTEKDSLSVFSVEVLASDKGSELFDFLVSIKEFAENYHGQEERFRQRLIENLKKDSTAYVIRDNNGNIIASAQAGAQCSRGTMLLGVGTDLSLRRKGLATKIMHFVCRDQFAKRRTFISLFFNNPEADRVYTNVGFKDIGTYTVLLNND